MVIFRKIALYLSIIGIGLLGFLLHKLSEPSPIPTPLAEPSKNPYKAAIAASGIVESIDRNLSVGVPESGLVSKVYAEVWDKVYEGQPLFQLDDRPLRAQLAVQEKQIQIDEANINRLQNQLRRLQSVSDKRAISQDELQTKEHDVEIARAQLALSLAKSDETRRLISRLTILAPRNGVILQNNVRVGEFVSATHTFNSMLLGNMDKLQIRTDIDEQNANRIHPDMLARAFPKNQPDRTIALKFEKIEPYVIPKRSLIGNNDERVDTRVLQVLYSFDKPRDFPIFIGQQMDVFIEMPQSTESQHDISNP